MSLENGGVEIVVCLGSSCFARGNSENLALITEFVESRGLKASVRMRGKLCQDECIQGPNLSINGVVHHGVTTAKLRELLQRFEGAERSDYGTH